MKQLVKINNGELSFRLKLNYNNVYSRLKMLLGKKASVFADISTKSLNTTWYASDDAEYGKLSEATEAENKVVSQALKAVIDDIRKELANAPELANYADDILEIPDSSFVFYRKTADGYMFVLAGWGCKFAHVGSTDLNNGFIKRLSKNYEFDKTSNDLQDELNNKGYAESIDNDVTDDLTDATSHKSRSDEKQESTEDKKDFSSETIAQNKDYSNDKTKINENQSKEEKAKSIKKYQHVILQVLNQNSQPVTEEMVNVRTTGSEMLKVTDADGKIEVGRLHYADTFGVSFPNIKGNQERSFEVEPNVEIYEAYIKKLVKYSPVLFVEDQNGNSIQNHKIKIIIEGQDTVYDTGIDGVVQLPAMLEGQKFVAVDTANYANTEEYDVTPAKAKIPYRFKISRAEKLDIGITILDKLGNPLPNAVVDVAIGDTPCQKKTGVDGRVEFPYGVFETGVIPINLNIKGQGQIHSELKFTPDITEYTIQLKDRKNTLGFNWKWLGLIPLLLLLAWGTNKLYEQFSTPSIKEMETGVVLIKSNVSYYVDFSVGEDIKYADGTPLRYYFTYDENSRKYGNFTHDPSKRIWETGWGTGFLISEDGLIATNRHIADPIPPKEATKIVKSQLLKDKFNFQQLNDSLNDVLRRIAPLRLMNEQYALAYNKALKEQEYTQNQISTLEKIMNLGEFNVEVECYTSVAFVNSIIENWDDFISCSFRASGDPGSVAEKDVAIIQLKNKKRDIPEGTYVFKVPEKDLMDEEISDNYNITVLGYNKGPMLADIRNGIHPQAQPGKITIKTEKYRIGYNASTLGGSSGSPVFNKKGQLVAVNNSGLADTQGFNYGIRIKYLKELLDNILDKNKKTTK